MKVYLDQDGCISCGMCANICPDIFAMTEGGPAEVCEGNTYDNYNRIKEAEECCPVKVIGTENE